MGGWGATQEEEGRGEERRGEREEGWNTNDQWLKRGEETKEWEEGSWNNEKAAESGGAFLYSTSSVSSWE